MRLACALLAASIVHAAPDVALDVPFYAQQKNGCGAASVAMVMSYWSKQPLEQPVVAPPASETYKRLYDPQNNGILLADMQRYFEENGFRAFTLRAGIDGIEEHLTKGRPVIVGLKKSNRAPLHFAVVVQTSADQVLLNDPTRKKISRMNRDKFEQHWQRADRWMLLAVPASR